MMYIPDDYINVNNYFRYKVLHFLPVIFRKYILEYSYKKFYKQNLNLKSPKRLSEKIQWLKINGEKKDRTYLTDKLQVKNYIKRELPELKCAQVYQIGKTFEDLVWDWEKLPQQFVLKTNHSCKTNIFIENKKDVTDKDYIAISKFYKKVLNINYAYWSYFEMQYKDITPFVFAEEFLGYYYEIKTYEVWCFNGEVEFIMYKEPIKRTNHMDSVVHYYNSKWEELDFYIDGRGKDKVFPSKNRDKVIEYSKILSRGVDFVRVDIMEVKDELYFGEMTFTPFSGYFNIVPESYDLILGEKLKLDNKQ